MSGWRKKERLWGLLFIGPNLLGVTLFFILPALFSFGLLFTDYRFANPDMNFVGLGNLKRLFHDELFYLALKNTALFLASVPVSIGLAFLVALALNKSVYLRSLLRAMFFMPYITSGIAIAFVWMLLFQPSKGPINQLLRAVGIENPPGWFSTTDTSMLAIDIIWIWFMLGYFMIIYLAALQELNSELLEAAKIDGARGWVTVRRIIWPLVSPTTFLLLVTGLIMSIKTFGIIQAITQGGPGNSTTIVSLYVYRTAFSYYEMGYASAISWVLFAIILFITLIQWFGQKKWVHY
ncbi:carbohydrate ABC transporter permease [Paenibacillus methanolicus]|uniref:Multiple sugar transport system permease protein n=1 Tax=Paenibacillus methanolicus TaxID=582686 RepID=A0A5S5CJE2_9BACL|nr:sugar ABC transporter permease [Paenibacillus methanolicus]TYP79133.1 multiple sugar transport system permease protein [Paenibacillus methanolicus]